MSANNDKLKGTANTSVGNLKEGIGKATGNQNLEAEGAVQKTKGHAQQLSGSIRETIKKAQVLLGAKPKKD
jgi:uncharacterized protein YjbJ (UPF0337 family)